MWLNVFRALAVLIILVELRQVLIGGPVHEVFLALAAGFGGFDLLWPRGGGKGPPSSGGPAA